MFRAKPRKLTLAKDKFIMYFSLLIFFGAGLGGVSRYWVSNGIYSLLGRGFPYGTLFVNASGSFLMGLFFVLIMDRFTTNGSELRAFILIGFLGGYTTFSSFSIETWQLIENGAWVTAASNVFFSLLLCLCLTWLGILGGRQL